MKQIIGALILCTGMVFIPSISYSQDLQECVVVDVEGKPIDLGNLCGESSQNATKTINSKNISHRSDVFSTPIVRRESGIPVIKVQFNNQHTYEMLVDTGASFTLVTPEMADKIGIKPDGVILMSTPSDSNVPVPTARIASVSSGGATSRNLTVAISPTLPYGLLGQNFFGHYDMTIKQNAIEFRVR